MNDLKEFAKHIESGSLREFTSLKLRQLRMMDAPLLQDFRDIKEEEALERLEANNRELLLAMQAGTVEELLVCNMKAWEADLAAGTACREASLADIILINAAERSAFISLLPSYAKTVPVAVAIMEELERYYTQSHRLSAYTIQRIREEEAQRLHESEERYKDLFDNATDLIHIVQPDGLIMYVNKAWQEAVGYTEEELKGASVYDLIGEKERERFRAYRERIVAGLPAIETLVTTLRTKQGPEIIVEGFISCKFRAGKPLYTRGILRNITQRRSAEQQIQFYTEQLIEREENLRQMIRNAPDAIIVIDSSSIIRLWNPMAERMFGWEAMDVVGRDLAETIIPVHYREGHRAGIRRYLETGEERMMHRTIETTALNKAGEELYISLTISGTRQAGEPVFIAFVRDISLQKQNALELERKKEQLERTNKELEQFAWLASHDLKEPLRKIRTFSDLLLRKPDLPSDVTPHLRKIQHSAIRMSNLIEDLLSYSDAGSAREEFVLANLKNIVQDVLIDLEVSIKMRSARVNVSDLPGVEVLPFQMRQLFQNLISNALKYSKPDTDPIIEITGKKVAGDFAEICVSDNGIGFKEEYADKAFQIFQRLVNREDYEGTGIGLALCKKIVENHHGSISVKSREGIGTTFTILLPLVRYRPSG